MSPPTLYELPKAAVIQLTRSEMYRRELNRQAHLICASAHTKPKKNHSQSPSLFIRPSPKSSIILQKYWKILARTCVYTVMVSDAMVQKCNDPLESLGDGPRPRECISHGMYFDSFYKDTGPICSLHAGSDCVFLLFRLIHRSLGDRMGSAGEGRVLGSYVFSTTTAQPRA
jgi:hypothetical protein